MTFNELGELVKSLRHSRIDCGVKVGIAIMRVLRQSSVSPLSAPIMKIVRSLGLGIRFRPANLVARL
jgi:hypothetical protein